MWCSTSDTATRDGGRASCVAGVNPLGEALRGLRARRSPRSVTALPTGKVSMTLPDAPTHGRSLRSTITSDGQVRLSLEERPLPELEDGQVVVAVEASPINPSDLGVLLGPVRPDGLRRDGDDLVGSVPAELLPRVRDRLDKSLPVGNEGAGTVVAGVPELVGKRVALFGGSMWADYRVADAGAGGGLPGDVRTAEGAAALVNPPDPLAMVAT